MPVRLGIFELTIVFVCLLVFIALAVALAVLLLRSRPAAGDERSRRGGDIPDVLTPDEVAALLRVDVETVENLIRDGKLPAVKVGNDWRVSRANVIAFIDAGGNAEDESQP